MLFDRYIVEICFTFSGFFFHEAYFCFNQLLVINKVTCLVFTINLFYCAQSWVEAHEALPWGLFFLPEGLVIPQYLPGIPTLGVYGLRPLLYELCLPGRWGQHRIEPDWRVRQETVTDIEKWSSWAFIVHWALGQVLMSISLLLFLLKNPFLLKYNIHRQKYT